MPNNILNDDWAVYDNRKIRDKRDGNRFSCDESWEVDYLVQKIVKIYPIYSSPQVRSAIIWVCNNTTGRMRKEFVSNVMARLKAVH